MERDTLSGYPVELQRAGFDLTSMLDHASAGETPEEGQVGVLQRVTDLFSTLDSNDLKAFKAFLDSGESGVEQYAAAVEYGYDLAPQIYRIEGQGVRQVHPDQSFADLGLGSSVSASGVMSGMMSTDVFSQLPESTALYREQYALKAGRWPESSQECVLVLTAGGSVSDLTLYTLGLRDAGELEQMVQQFLHEEDVDTPETLGTYGYDDILGITFQVVSSSDYYQYDSEYQVWRDKRDDLAYMQDLVEAGEPLTVVGIVQPTGDSGGQLQSGLAYPASLTHHMAELAAGSQIVQEQLAQPDINIFTNEPFGQESGESGFSLSSLFHIDQAALEELFTLDQQALADNLTGALSLDMEGFRLEDLNLESGVQWEELLTDLPQPDLAQLLEGVQFQVTEEGLNGLAAGLMTGWQDYVAANPQADYSELGPSFLAFLRTEEGSRLLSGEVEQILSANGISAPGPKEVEALVNRLLTGFLTYCGEKHPEWFDPEGEPQLDLLLPAGLSEYLATGEAQEIMAQWTAQAFPTQGLTITQEQMEGLAAALSQGYGAYAEAEGLPDPTQMGRYFTDYLGTETAQSLLAQAAASMVDASGLQTQLTGALAGYGQALGETISQKLGDFISSALAGAADQIALRLQSSLAAGMENLGANLTNTFRLTPDALAEVVSVTMDAGELSELLRSMSAAQGASYEGNLEALDYVDFDNPSSIRIYPLDFESKAKITGILEDYNHHMEEEGREEQVITYSDVVGALMSSVTDIIDIVSQVLIAFVALSLVVSSIMIGVITYISVLERRKEIGILRAIGASRRNISQVFTAETFIIGLGAGLIGVGFTLLVLIPGNALIHQLAGTDQINAFLPVGGAVILVLLSVLLTLLSVLLPAGKAAKSDPVAALRSD